MFPRILDATKDDMLNNQGLAEAQRLAAAASTRPVVRSPRRMLLRQTAAHGWQLGLGAIYRLATGLRSVSQRDAPDESFLHWLSRLSGDTPAAADASTPFVPAAFRFGAAPVPAGIEEGSYWIAYAAGSYARTLPAVVAQLRACGVRDASAEHIIYAQLEPLPLLQPHFIARDPAKKVIVIAIRGTATLRDVIADSAARPIPFAGGAAHTGMAAAVDGLLHYAVDWAVVNLPLAARAGAAAGAAPVDASGAAAADTRAASPGPAPPDAGFSVPFVQGLAQLSTAEAVAAAGGVAGAAGGSAGIGATAAFSPYQVIPDVSAMGLAGVAAILQRALAAYPDHRIVVTGHSLGGGIAALLTCRIVRIRLFWHRRHLEELTKQAQEQAAASASREPLPAAVHGTGEPDVAAAMAGKEIFETLTPSRPINCWAYASPACLSPELSAFAALSMADLERFMLQDDDWAAEHLGREATDRFRAAFERTNRTSERIAALRRHDNSQQEVPRSDGTPWSSDSRTFALETAQELARARLDAGPETWPLHTRLPIVSSVIYADDMVPRLTVASLADLAARLQRGSRRKGRLSFAAFSSVGWSLQALACGGRCTWCVTGSAAAVEAAPDSQPPGSAAAPPPITGTDAAPDCAPSAVTMSSDSHSAAMQPLEPLEAAAADAAHPLHRAAIATSSAQETAAVGDNSFASRLEATGIAEPVRRAVLRLVASTRPVWVDPSQDLVAPGCLWLVSRVATGSTPAAQDASDRQPAVGPSTMVTVGASGASQRQYAIRHVAPVVLRRIVISPTMLTDHMVGEYRACLAVLPSGGGGGGGEAAGGAGAS